MRRKAQKRSDARMVEEWLSPFQGKCFADDPRAALPDYGRIPLPETWVPTITIMTNFSEARTKTVSRNYVTRRTPRKVEKIDISVSVV